MPVWSYHKNVIVQYRFGWEFGWEWVFHVQSVKNQKPHLLLSEKPFSSFTSACRAQLAFIIVSKVEPFNILNHGVMNLSIFICYYVKPLYYSASATIFILEYAIDCYVSITLLTPLRELSVLNIVSHYFWLLFVTCITYFSLSLKFLRNFIIPWSIFHVNSLIGNIYSFFFFWKKAIFVLSPRICCYGGNIIG